MIDCPLNFNNTYCSQGRSKLPQPIVNEDGVTTNSTLIKEWKKCDTTARVILMATITPKEQQAFVNCKSAFAIWEKLTAQYLQNASASTHVLQASFFNYQYVSEHNMMTHITAIENLAQQLEDLGQPMSESQIMTKIVSTLPYKFRGFMTVWDNLSAKEKTMPQLITKLMNEQHRNTCSSPLLEKSSMKAPNAEAFTATKSYNFRNNQHQDTTRNYKKQKVLCEYCGKAGHTEAECRRRINEENGTPDVICSYCKCYDHTESICQKKIRHERNHSKRKTSNAKLSLSNNLPFALGASTRQLTKGGWYADSGATHHMCEEESIMHNYIPTTSTSWTVNGIGGIQLIVRGQGSVHITTTVCDTMHAAILHDVLHVPGLDTNLLSIASVTDRGIDVHFKNQNVTFVREGTIVMTGKRTGRNLYFLNITTRKNHRRP